jgi:hypothetical protein
VQVYVCVRCFGYLPVVSDLTVVSCLLWRLHCGIGEAVGSLPVFPVWSECVCVVCVCVDKVLVLRVSGGTLPIGTMCCGFVLGILLCECFCVCAVFECVCVASVCVGLGMISTSNEAAVSCVCGVYPA